MVTTFDPYKTAFKDYVPKGTLLPIFTYPSPVLKKKASPVTQFDEELKSLCLDMLYTMYQAPGIGLAAPQVGKALRLFVMDINYKRSEVTRADGHLDHELSDFNPLIFINPILEKKEGEILYQEGCLSVPGIYEDVKRFESCLVKFQDWDGNQHSLEVHELLSVCIQHENDHLNGVVFLERLSMLKKNILMKKYIKQRKKKENDNT